MPEGTAQGSGTTIKGALSEIQSARSQNKFSGGKKAVIVIKGTVTTATESPAALKNLISITGQNRYPPLVFRGDSASGVLDAEKKGRIFYIEDNEVTIAANLTLKNGQATADTSNDNMGGAVFMLRSTLNMTGGAIADCIAGVGSAVSIVGWLAGSTVGVFNMSGGEIYGCVNKRKSDGGTVYVQVDQKMTLSGTAKIHHNGTDDNTIVGGGIVLNGGILEMSGGEISNNRAYEKGGGVRSIFKSTFKMSGGIITNNTAPTGGGVSFATGTFTKSGTASVTGNSGGDEVQTQY
jgi:hypothetical protein